VLDGVFSDRSEQSWATTNESAAPQVDAAPQQDPITKNESGVRYRALVVDDSRMIRMQVGLALQDADVEVENAASGENALQIINQEDFDIIFLDVIMTGIDGYEVCKAIKRDKARRHIPVVMLTSQSSPFDKIRGKFCGCDAYLTKPVRREEFQKTLDQYLVKALSND
jgi:twitching motility two-component system response regulator PilG